MTSDNSKLRLVHCIGSMRVGGAECQLMELIERLPRERFEQSLVLLRAEGGLMDRVRASGCEVVDLGLRRRASRLDPAWAFSLARMAFRYVGFLRRRRPDILHAQLSISNILSVIAGRLAGVPHILTAQLQLCNYKRNKPLLKWIENWTNRRASAVVVNSDAIRRDMMECDGLEPGRFRRVYNGVVLENFKPLDPAPLRRELGLDPDDLVLVVVANLHPYKGHDDLLRALALLLPRYPKLRLLLPGRDQGMGARLREMAQELGLENAVRFLGERRDVPALLAASDVAIHPSHEEGFSNSILEAMTSSLPLVVTRVGGNVEQVIEGENGFLVPLRDPEALAAALEKLLADPALRRRMGEASRRRIESEFSIERNVSAYAALYESLIAGKSS